MSNILTRSFSTPYGELILGSYNDELCLADWRYRRMRDAVDTRIKRGLNAGYEEGTSPVIEETMAQLNGYFAGDRKTFDVPLRFVGTDFQQRVWQALLNVPYGRTSTYALLTDQVAQGTAIRAVAAANGANAISIIVPCHRIVGSSGELVGYAGGLSVKKKLLQLEGAALPKLELELFDEAAEGA
jgi:methylated-DNA-[protein]-cysteine S-methyltransferase